MARLSEADLGRALARLQSLSSWDLREEWRRVHRAHPPKRISNDLLIRGIAYQLQEQAYGRLPAATRGKLEVKAGAPGTSASTQPKPRVTLKSGTRLVREWNGETYIVEVLSKGYRWRGIIFASLSPIAREITGAHWSGPRFFGLTSRAGATNE
ncbi:MAG: DUF2924 domain-containing protein [Alphaproteobacteria bacterium]|nr:DUF2924 domain-containing protein [Alphaproteobacteria bacterium]